MAHRLDVDVGSHKTPWQKPELRTLPLSSTEAGGIGPVEVGGLGVGPPS